MKKIIIALITVVMMLGLTVGAFALDAAPSSAVIKDVTLGSALIDLDDYTDIAAVPSYNKGEFVTSGEEKMVEIISTADSYYPLFDKEGGFDISKGIAIRIKNDGTELSFPGGNITPLTDGNTAAHPIHWYLISKDLSTVTYFDMKSVGATVLTVPANFDGYLGMTFETVIFSGGGTGVMDATGTLKYEAKINDLTKVKRLQLSFPGNTLSGMGTIYFGNVYQLNMAAKAPREVPANLNMVVVEDLHTLPYTVDADSVQVNKAINGEWFKQGDYGVAFRVKNPTNAAIQWRTRMDLYLEGENAANRAYPLNSTLFDLEGNVLEAEAGGWPSIMVPAGFEGYIVMPFANLFIEAGSLTSVEGAQTGTGADFSGAGYKFVNFTSYMLDHGKGLEISAAGYLTAEPTEPAAPTPTPTPTPTPEATTPPTGNPNTGAVSVVALAAVAVVSGGLVIRRKNH